MTEPVIMEVMAGARSVGCAAAPGTVLATDADLSRVANVVAIDLDEASPPT